MRRLRNFLLYNVLSKFKISDIIISFLLSVFVNAGTNFTEQQTIFVHFSISLFLRFITAWGLILIAINLFDYFLMWGIRRNNNRQYIENCSKHLFTKIFLVLIILWLPYLIVLYPGSAWYDCSSSILQIYGIRELSNWNPIIQTLLIGGFIKIGEMINDLNFGVFLYNFSQCIFASAVISYGIYSIYKKTKNRKTIFWGILFYGLLPVYPIYITSVGKDTNWSCFLLLSLICIYNIRDDPSWITKNKNVLFYYVALLGDCLLRNAGIYVAICFCIILIVVLPRQMRLKHSIRQLLLMIFILFWSNIFLTLLGVNVDNISRDKWNVQFQQIARYASLYSDEVTEEEKKTINFMLSYNDVSTKYNPNIVDTVTEVYYGDTISDENKQRFIEMYWGMFKKHPKCYVDAIIGKCYGYFTPLKSESVRPFTVIGVHDVYASIKRYLPDFGIYNVFELNTYCKYIEVLQKIPILNLTTRCGFWVWALFFEVGFVLRNRRKKYFLLFIPLFIIVLGLIVVPTNNYFRYILSLPFTLPFLLLGIYGTEETKNNEE